jgi:hypothetical protein
VPYEAVNEAGFVKAKMRPYQGGLEHAAVHPSMTVNHELSHAMMSKSYSGVNPKRSSSLGDSVGSSEPQ